MAPASSPEPTAPSPAAARPRLSPLRSQPLKEQVLEQLRALLDGGALKPGDQLPSERELSEELQVSRGTVREAVQFLGALGLVEIRHGQGTFVRATLANPEVHDEWRAWTLRNSGRIRDLLEVRRGLESFAAELAAQRRAERELRALEETLGEMEAAINSGDVTALVRCDVNFHHGLCAAAQNPALVELADVLGQRLLRERAATWDVPGRPHRSLEEHTTIFNAVTSGDAARARATVIAHLDSVERDLGLIADPDVARHGQRKE